MGTYRAHRHVHRAIRGLLSTINRRTAEKQVHKDSWRAAIQSHRARGRVPSGMEYLPGQWAFRFGEDLTAEFHWVKTGNRAQRPAHRRTVDRNGEDSKFRLVFKTGRTEKNWWISFDGYDRGFVRVNFGTLLSYY